MNNQFERTTVLPIDYPPAGQSTVVHPTSKSPSSSANNLSSQPVALPLNRLRGHSATAFSVTARLLAEGGDTRIVCDTLGRNRYGCTPVPEPEVLAYGSSTASTISPAGFAAADALRNRLKIAADFEPAYVTYERELNRIRARLIELCGLEDMKGLDIICGASGTDLHLFASQLMVDDCELRPIVVRVEASETGSGVPDALAGRHFSECAAFGDSVAASVPLDCGRPIDIYVVKSRTVDGQLRSLATIDAELEDHVIRTASSGHRVLLNLIDVSKTGLLAPSPACAARLRRRFPDLIEVLVDACQFRLATSTLKAYLEHDFLVAITGSKFITGPTFCGALLVPSEASHRLRSRKLPVAVKAYSAQADWPQPWAARSILNRLPNYGLLLRWEAALTELRAFRQLPEDAIADFLKIFANTISRHITNNASFEMLPLPVLDRASVAMNPSWDQFPTIFPFLLLKASPSENQTWLNQSETKRVHELLRGIGCQVGQPVACGTRRGRPVSALRLCLSSRLIVDALARGGRGSQTVIAEAISVLEKAARLASLPLN